MRRFLFIFILFLSLFLTLFSCSKNVEVRDERSRFLIITDNLARVQWDKETYNNSIKEYIKNNYINDLNFEVIDSDDSYKNLLESREKFFGDISSYKNVKGVIVTKPSYNTGKNMAELLVLFGTPEAVSETVSDDPGIISTFEDLKLKLDKVIIDKRIVDSKKIYSLGSKSKNAFFFAVDRTNNLTWDSSALKSAYEAFIKENTKEEFVFQEIEINSEEKLLENPLETVKDFFDPKLFGCGHVFYIKPLAVNNYTTGDFHIIYTSLNIKKEEITSFNESISNPAEILNILKTKHNNLSEIFDNFNYGYYWKYEPVKVTVVEEKKESVKITDKFLNYSNYTDIINKNGTFLMIQSIDDLFQRGFIEFDKAITNGEIDYSKPLILEIINFFNDNGCQEFFYDADNNELNKSLVFFEYITTGSRAIKLLYGPVNESSYKDIREKLKSKKINTYNELIYPSDLK